jgi:hypothetical protein
MNNVTTEVSVDFIAETHEANGLTFGTMLRSQILVDKYIGRRRGLFGTYDDIKPWHRDVRSLSEWLAGTCGSLLICTSLLFSILHTALAFFPQDTAGVGWYVLYMGVLLPLCLIPMCLIITRLIKTSSLDSILFSEIKTEVIDVSTAEQLPEYARSMFMRLTAGKSPQLKIVKSFWTNEGWRFSSREVHVLKVLDEKFDMWHTIASWDEYGRSLLHR